MTDYLEEALRQKTDEEAGEELSALMRVLEPLGNGAGAPGVFPQRADTVRPKEPGGISEEQKPVDQARELPWTDVMIDEVPAEEERTREELEKPVLPAVSGMPGLGETGEAAQGFFSRGTEKDGVERVGLSPVAEGPSDGGGADLSRQRERTFPLEEETRRAGTTLYRSVAAAERAAGFARTERRNISVTVPEERTGVSGLDAETLDRAVERDARRYDGGFELY